MNQDQDKSMDEVNFDDIGFRVCKKERLVIPRSMALDQSISHAARGFLLFLLAHPEDTTIDVDGTEEIALELEKAGYIINTNPDSTGEPCYEAQETPYPLDQRTGK